MNLLVIKNKDRKWECALKLLFTLNILMLDIICDDFR